MIILMIICIRLMKMLMQMIFINAYLNDLMRWIIYECKWVENDYIKGIINGFMKLFKWNMQYLKILWMSWYENSQIKCTWSNEILMVEWNENGDMTCQWWHDYEYGDMKHKIRDIIMPLVEWIIQCMKMITRAFLCVYILPLFENATCHVVSKKRYALV